MPGFTKGGAAEAALDARVDVLELDPVTKTYTDAADITSGSVLGNTLTLLRAGGLSPIAIDVTTLAADIKVVSGSYNDTTKAIDFVCDPISGNFSVPVAALLPVTAAKSLTGNGSTTALELVGDEATPTASTFYGTSSTGAKGYHPLSDASNVDIGVIVADPAVTTDSGQTVKTLLQRLLTRVDGRVKIDGTTPFAGAQSGVNPTAAAHLTTKTYVDTQDSALDTRLDALEVSPVTKTYVDTQDSALDTRLDALEVSPVTKTYVDTQDSALDTRLDALEVSPVTKTYVDTQDSALDTRLDALEVSPVTKTYVDTQDAALDARVNARVKIDGTTPFTGAQSGVTPTLAAHLATKSYVDTQDATLAASDISSGSVAGNTLTLTRVGGGTITVDVTTLAADVTIVSGSYNATTKAIDFVANQAAGNFSVPVSALLPVSVSGSISGNGSTTALSLVGDVATPGNNKVYGTDATGARVWKSEAAVSLGVAAPVMNGVAASGSSANVSREDHVHPTDTTRAPLSSPAFVGLPTAPTAAAGTNTTQLATTAYVLAAATAVIKAAATGDQVVIGETRRFAIGGASVNMRSLLARAIGAIATEALKLTELSAINWTYESQTAPVTFAASIAVPVGVETDQNSITYRRTNSAALTGATFAADFANWSQRTRLSVQYPTMTAALADTATLSAGSIVYIADVLNGTAAPAGFTAGPWWEQWTMTSAGTFTVGARKRTGFMPVQYLNSPSAQVTITVPANATDSGWIVGATFGVIPDLVGGSGWVATVECDTNLPQFPASTPSASNIFGGMSITIADGALGSWGGQPIPVVANHASPFAWYDVTPGHSQQRIKATISAAEQVLAQGAIAAQRTPQLFGRLSRNNAPATTPAWSGDLFASVGFGGGTQVRGTIALRRTS
jgi:hypothetical protein